MFSVKTLFLFFYLQSEGVVLHTVLYLVLFEFILQFVKDDSFQ